MVRLPMTTLLLVAVSQSPAIRWQPTALPAPGPKGSLTLPDGRILIPGGGPQTGGRTIYCHATADGGKTWTRLGPIATDPDPTTDLGDGNLVRLRDGTLLATFRRNHLHGPAAENPDYAIEVAESRDGGRTWRPHSTVETSRPGSPRPSRGLWAPFLLVTRKGEVQCYYDDEDTPWRRHFKGHQWLVMRTLNRQTRRWERPVTVSRAPNPKHLSRDGMAAVAERADGILVCAFESVQTAPPHAGVLRVVTSHDGGRNWSWARGERPVLYEPKDVRYHAFSPWLLPLPNGDLLCAFATNEDRPEPGISGTPAHRLNLDVKTTLSRDGGRTWGPSATLYTGTNRNYLPSLTPIPGGPAGTTRVLATFLDFDRGSLSLQGEIIHGK
ncbi:MAG: sialidase family protein [Fimbriimonas sp.]